MDSLVFDDSVRLSDELLYNDFIPLEMRLLLKMAFEEGGYVAGGFARILAKKAYDPSNDVKWYRTHVKDYLMSSKIHTKGDVDVFFEDRNCLKAFKSRVEESRALKSCLTIAESPTGSATEYVSTQSNAKLQVIHKYVMPLRDQLNSFDICNAMVAVTPSGIWTHSDWKDLEEKKQLHVCNWASPFVVNRVFKWMIKHRYESLTRETEDVLTLKIIELTRLFEQKPMQLPWGKLMSGSSVKLRAQALLKFLNESNLLLLAATEWGPDEYNYAFNHFKKLSGR